MIHTFEVGDDDPTNRTVDEHRTWEDQGFFVPFGVPWSSWTEVQEFTDRKKTGMI